MSHITHKTISKSTQSSFPDLLARRSFGEIGESTLRQAQGDNCHGELVEPWIGSLPRT